MNAKEKGKQHGFAYNLSIIGGSKRHFEHVGQQSAQAAYKQPEKQAEYLQGWMLNWSEPHQADCACAVCSEEIPTY